MDANASLRSRYSIGVRRGVYSVEQGGIESCTSIILAASISGGTGGGMVIDVVHILRQLLDDAGMAEAIVIPILTLSNPGSGPEESLRTINSCAVLREMQHFLSAANGYPGDEGAGFPSCPAARSPLHNTYLVSTGNAQDSVTSPPQMIAQYIWEDCTAAGAILAEARKLVVDTSVPVHERLQSSVRSVGAIGLQANVGEGQHLIAPACICTLLQTWLGDPAQARQLAGPTSQRLLRRLGLVSESFTKTLLGRKGDSVRMSILERVFGKHMHEEAGQVEIEMIEQPLQPTIQRAHQQVMPEMELNNAISQIQSELAKRLEDSRTDLATAIESLELVCQHLHLMADGLNQDSIDDQFDQHFDSQLALMRTAHDSDDASEGDADTVTEDLRKLVDADDTDTDTATNSISIATQPLSHPRSRFGESESIEWPQEVSLLDCDVADLQVIDSEPSTLINRANLVLDRAVSEIASTRIDGLIASLRHLQKQLVQHGIMIARVMSTFGRWKQGKEDPWASLPSLLRNRRKTILSLLHSTLSRELLSSVVMHPDISISQEATTQRLTIVATRLVRDQLQKDVEAIEETSTTAESVVPSLPVQQVGDAIACIRPSLLQFGGWQRLLLLVSCESEMNSMRPAVEKAHDGIVSTIILQGVSPTLIFEAQQIQLNEILERWGAYLGGQASAATRLHAR
ncbi:MAG: tubulin-like doman-containing protein, partial [Planctomycetota bacterium]